MSPPQHNMLHTFDLAGWITEIIVEFHLNSPDNSLRFGHHERIFDKPLVGFSNGGVLCINSSKRTLVHHM